jgi:hypothetical protein
MQRQQLLHTANDHVDNDYLVLVNIFIDYFIHLDNSGDNDDHYYQHHNHYRASDLL